MTTIKPPCQTEFHRVLCLPLISLILCAGTAGSSSAFDIESKFDDSESLEALADATTAQFINDVTDVRIRAALQNSASRWRDRVARKNSIDIDAYLNAIPQPTRGDLAGLFHDRSHTLLDSSQDANDQLGREIDTAKEEWKAIRSNLVFYRLNIGENYGRVVTSVAVFAVLLLSGFWIGRQTFLAYRHELRRSGARAVFRLLPVYLVLAVLLLGSVIFAEWSNWKRLSDIAITSEEVRDTVNSSDLALVGVAASQSDAGPEPSSRQAGDAGLGDNTEVPSIASLPEWVETRETLYEVVAKAQVLDQTVRDTQRDTRELGKVRAIIWQGGVLRFVELLAIGAGVVLASSRLRKTRRNRRKDRARICPKCFNGLGAETSERLWPSEEKRTPKNTDVVCTNRWDGTNTCNFRIREDRLDAVRLCFPLVGVATSGKTYWLATNYHQLHMGRASEHFALTPIDTEALSEVRRVLQLLHGGKRPAKGTKEELPDPVIFELDDQDPFGSSRILMNLFDYAGEVGRQDFHQSTLYRRMLKADGLVLFLDPMQSGRLQLERVEKLVEDIDRVELSAPAAICITKIDELASRSSSPETGEFLEALRKLEGDAIDCEDKIAACEIRSRLTTRFLSDYWQDVPIEERINRAFPGNYMFFPVTSTGFTSEGDPAWPHYTLDPLIWLLHKNGYLFSSPKRNAE